MKSVKPKKHLGQHFLTDLGIARRIADTVDACPEIPVLEIGPGMGVLTQYLVEKPREVKAVEIDKESVAYLYDRFPKLRDNIIGDDFLRTLSIYKKVKETLQGIWLGITSLRGVRNVPLFILYSLAIWASYFLHFYLTFFCFKETASLGLTCALVCFVVGSIAVIVPTPNGAGPWHFAVKTMLMLYGVAYAPALFFVLIVHTVQTLLVVLLGIYAWIVLAFMKKRKQGQQPAAVVADNR